MQNGIIALQNMQIDSLRSLVVEQQMRGVKYSVGTNGSDPDPVANQLPRSVSGYDDVVDFDINQQLRKLLTVRTIDYSAR